MKLYRSLIPLYLYNVTTLLLFLIAIYLPEDDDRVLIFLIGFVWFLIFFFSHFRSRPAHREGRYLPNAARPLLLFGFSVSAHTLNLLIPVFATYEPLFLGVIVATHIALLVYPVRKLLPGWANAALRFTMGLGVVTWLYMAIFIAPVAGLSIPLIIALGISSHAFVPLLLMIWFVRRSLTDLSPAFWTGVTLPLLAILGTEIQWYGIQKDLKAVHATYTDIQARSDYTGVPAPSQSVPEWVALAQRVPDGILTRKVVLAETHSQMTGFAMPDKILGSGARIKVRHDPLVVIASWLYGPTGIDEETAVHLLEARYDARHDTHRRLWSDEDVITEQVKTRATIWPAHRLAYMEKTLKVAVKDDGHSWQTDREAVYSFLLPEGAVATSLSLWVNGVERPSRLTTRAKADDAYVQIVRQEQRDPALLHWQEGNRVTITIFPVRKDLSRQFKVGITVPLSLEDGKLVLRNIPFRGPDYSDAQENAEIQFADGKLPEDVRTPWRFNRHDKGKITCYAAYRPDWEINFPVQPLASGSFCFEGSCVHLSPLPHTHEFFAPEEILLDVNAAWTPAEIETIWKIARKTGAVVSSCQPEPTPVNPARHTEQLARLNALQYQLLPLYLLHNPEKTLIITKEGSLTPMLSDLEESPFATGMRQYLTGMNGKVRVFSLSNQPPAWLGALHQLRAIHLATGDEDALRSLLQRQQFPLLSEDSTQVALPVSDMLITRTAQVQPAPGTPDHVMRLFAYNDLLSDIGRQYYDRAALEETWLRKAEKAYVVSPVSSMLVLETDADYERMRIPKNQRTLGNAKEHVVTTSIQNDLSSSNATPFNQSHGITMNATGNTGAVPEPHEWALLVLFLLSLGWFTWMKRK